MSEDPLVRVSRQHPCPICGKPDWCGVSADGAVCVCMRVSDGALKRTPNGGHLHILKPSRGQRGDSPRTRVVRIQSRQIDMSQLANRYAATVDSGEFARLAQGLSLSPSNLIRLGVGWAAEHHAWSFPMCQADGRVCGIRLRSRSGRKWAVRGSREGLFLPKGLNCAQGLLIAEGPTDCAALLDLAFEVVGRPSCAGGLRQIVRLIRNTNPPAVAVVADEDEPGQRGAESLARALLPYAASVRVVYPPAGVKDARAWKVAGATHADILQAIDAAETGRITVYGRTRYGNRRTLA